MAIMVYIQEAEGRQLSQASSGLWQLIPAQPHSTMHTTIPCFPFCLFVFVFFTFIKLYIYIPTKTNKSASQLQLGLLFLLEYLFNCGVYIWQSQVIQTLQLMHPPSTSCMDSLRPPYTECNTTLQLRRSIHN